MEKQNVVEIWNEVLEIVGEKIPNSTFEPWLVPMVPQSYDENQFTVLTGHLMAKQIITQQYYSVITDAFKEVLGKNINFNMVVDKVLRQKLEKEYSKQAKEDEKKAATDKNESDSKYDNLKQMQSFCNLNLKYRFENFVVGSGSKFAHAAAMTVAKSPGKKYNPLFIYGNSGLGKTHLLQSIGHYILYNYPALRVKYLKSEEFLNELIQCLMRGGDTNTKMDKFRQKYRNIDVLLIDDIQFIEGKERMKEELFNTFESLYLKEKQIVFTSDRPPKDIGELPERLRSRFEMGLLADIQPPDIETRMAILSNLAKENSIEVPFEIINFLATVYSRNVRELEGAFNKITAYASIYETPLTLDVVKKAINYDENRKQVTLNSVLAIVSKYFNIPEKELLGTARAAKIANARQLAIYLAKELTNENLVSIGEFFDKKHSTILYSYDKVKSDAATNRILENTIEELKKMICE